MDRDLKQNLGARSTWLRGLFMLLFVFIFSLTELIVAAVAIFQFLAVLFTGRTNARLDQFGRGLSRYVYEMVQFFTFAREERPFPFSPWPEESAARPTRRPRKRRPAKKKSGAARPGSTGTEPANERE